DPSGSYAHSAPPPMTPGEMELESQILVSKKQLVEAETLIGEAIKIEPQNTQLYLRRVQIHFAMAQKADAESEDLKNKILDSGQSRTRSATAPPAAEGSGTSTESHPNAAESPEQGNLRARADAKAAEALKYYQAVVQDCNRVLAGRSSVADA